MLLPRLVCRPTRENLREPRRRVSEYAYFRAVLVSTGGGGVSPAPRLTKVPRRPPPGSLRPVVRFPPAEVGSRPSPIPPLSDGGCSRALPRRPPPGGHGPRAIVPRYQAPRSAPRRKGAPPPRCPLRRGSPRSATPSSRARPPPPIPSYAPSRPPPGSPRRRSYPPPHQGTRASSLSSVTGRP